MTWWPVLGAVALLLVIWLVTRRRTTPPAARAGDPVLAGEPSATPAGSDDHDHALAEGLAHDLQIRYRDSAGHVTERRITVHGVRGRAQTGPVSISAYCHAHKGARTFRIDRIGWAADAATGEVYATPMAAVQSVMAASKR